MATDGVTAEHRAELLSRLSPVYAVTAALDATGGIDDAERAQLREVAADLVEIVVLMDPAEGAGAEAVLTAVAALPPDERLKALEAWRDAVEAASGGRPGLRRVLNTPVMLLTDADAARHAALVDAWPSLGIAAGKLDDQAWATAFRIASERSDGAAAGALLGAAAHAAVGGHGDVPGLLEALATRLDAVDASERDAWSAALPQLSASAKGLGATGLIALLDEVAELPDAASRAAHLAFLAPFGEIDGDALTAAHALARRASSIDRADLLDRLTEACPIEKLLETTDGSRLMATLGKLVKTTASADDRLFTAEVLLLADVSEGHPSSAFALAEGLLERLPQVERSRAADYVEDFGRLVGVTGLRGVGFGLKQLPRLYAGGPDDARAFVAAVVAVGETDGPTAAQWFLDRRTKAGKDAPGS